VCIWVARLGVRYAVRCVKAKISPCLLSLFVFPVGYSDPIILAGGVVQIFGSEYRCGNVEMKSKKPCLLSGWNPVPEVRSRRATTTPKAQTWLRSGGAG
jgi:hypothetical protein